MFTEKNTQRHCPHCARFNWHANTHCSWCARPLPSRSQVRFDRIIFVVSLVVIAAVATWAMI